MLRFRDARTARPLVGPRQGFGLIELMIAIMMLTVGMLGMASLMASSMKRQRLSNSRTEMTSIAEAKLEELRSYTMTPSADPLRARLAVGGSLTTPIANYSDSSLALNGRWYMRRWQVSTGVAATRRVDVRVLPRTPVAFDVRSLDFSTLMVFQ